MEKVLVIIVTYNGMKWIDRCIGCLSQSIIPVDVFVVDNNSTDGTPTYIKEHFPNCMLIESKQNLGFGKANNLGLKYALENNYDFVYLLNQDAWIFEDTLSKLIEVYRNDSSFGILSPLQTNSECSKLDRNFEYNSPKEMLSDISANNCRAVYETRFIMAAHWLLPKETIFSVGGFSPSFPHYGEDVDYVNRVHYHGYKVGVVPSVKGVHDREHRVESKDLKIRKRWLESVVVLNNPCKKGGVQILIKQLIHLLYYGMKNCSISIFKYGVLLVKKYPYYVKNRNISRGKTAFI